MEKSLGLEYITFKVALCGLFKQMSVNFDAPPQEAMQYDRTDCYNVN